MVPPLIATSTLLRLLFLLCFCHNSLANDQFLSETPSSFSQTALQHSADTDLSVSFRSDKIEVGNEPLEAPSNYSSDQLLRNSLQICENVPESSRPKELLPCPPTPVPAQFQVNLEKHWFQLVCEGSETAQYVTGPATPYQFPDKSEARVFLQVQAHTQEVTKLNPATDFVLGKCGSKSVYSFHEPLIHRRKLNEAVVHHTSTGKPLIVMMLSLNGIGKSAFYQRMPETGNTLESLEDKFPVFHFREHSLSESSFRAPGRGSAAFSSFPHRVIWEAFKQARFLTLANIEGCNVDWDASLSADHVAYEFYCALDLLEAEACSKERIAHETGFNYVKKFLSMNKVANLFVSSTLKVDQSDTLDEALAGFIQELVDEYGDSHEVALIVEGSNDGFEAFSLLLATSSLLDSVEDSRFTLMCNSVRRTSSIDLERTILKLAHRFNVRNPQHEEQNGSFDLLSSLVPLDRDCEDAGTLPWLCLKCVQEGEPHLSLLQADAVLLMNSVLKHINKEIVGSHCQEALEGVLTDVSEHVSGAIIVQFVLKVSSQAKFAGVFTNATGTDGLETSIFAYGRTLYLQKVYRTDRSGNLCNRVTRGDVHSPDFCVC